MEESNLREKKKEKDWACLFLSLIPTFGFFSLLFMAKKSGRAVYRRYGIIYAVMNAIAVITIVVIHYANNTYIDSEMNYMGMFSLAMRITVWPLPYPTYFISGPILTRIIYAIRFVMIYYKLALYFLLIVHTVILARGYLKYMSSVVRPREQLLSTEEIPAEFRRKNNLWILWSVCPPVAPSSIIYLGKKTKKRGAVVCGYVLTAITALTWVLLFLFNKDTTYYSMRNDTFVALEILLVWASVCIIVVCLLTSMLMKDDVLKSAYDQYKKDIKTHPHIEDKSWRAATGRWLPFSFIPVVGASSLIRVGTVTGKRNITRRGIFLQILSIAVIILYSVLASFYRFRINGIDLLENRALINAFIWPITGLTAFIATLYYRDIMIANAERLGNYKSEIDRELELNKAWNKRMIDAGSQADKAVAPIRESRDSSGQIINQNKEAVNKQSTHQGEGVIDINTCSEAELANLPGVTLPMAKQAVEYRESVGRFTSVDHFIKQFNIKPHFAVRILDMAEATLTTEARDDKNSNAEAPKQKEPNGIRRIDF